MFSRAMLLSLCSATFGAAAASGEVVLVQNGQPRAVLVVAADAPADEQLAAKEIQEHLLKMSGAQLPIRQEAPAGETAILIGGSPEGVAGLSQDPSAFLLRVRPGQVRLVGRSPEGTLFAAYELLEQLGCRWYMPGELGTVIPKQATISLREQETLQAPSFRDRHLQALPREDPWYRRQRLGGRYYPAAHGLGFRADLAAEPDLFSLVNGQRVARQWCVSNPEVVRRTVEAVKARLRRDPDTPWFGIGPNDGGGHCECEKCRAMDAGDIDPMSGEVSTTDRYIAFFNQVLEEVHKEFPGKKLCFYVYADYFRPPVRVKPNPHIVPALAPISLCRVHSMLNPVCPERATLGALLDAWSKLLPEIYYRGYYFNLADPGFPFSLVSRLREEIPYFKQKNIAGFRVECMPAWGSHTPTLWLAGKLFWKHDADVDALLKDFYTRFFGAAAAPMQRYFERMDASLHAADYHTGNAFDMPYFYPKAVRDAARADLEEARRLAARDDLASRRVAMFRMVFDYLEAFIAMRECQVVCDFVGAKTAFDRMEAIRKEAVALNPPALYNRAAESYTNRFWSACTLQGFERVTGGNELVAALPDVWDVELDPLRGGEEMGMARVRPRVESAMKLATTSRSWSDQGLRYYKGDAWYRTRVTIPVRFRGKRIFLWFGGVDEQAKVWVNGQLLGEGPRGAFRPFEFEATQAVRFGAPNDVVVRVRNLVVNELGTGGITHPAMFWCPAPGKEPAPTATP